MFPRDRTANVALFAAAGAAWALVAVLFTTRSPVGDVPVQLAGAFLLGAAVTLTALPLFWLGAFTLRRRIAYRGSWWRAGRRAGLIGMVVTLIVILRIQQAFSVPVGLFIVVMVVIVELNFTLRR